MKTGNREINIYAPQGSDKLPAVILISEQENAEEILKLTNAEKYILVTVGNINWNDDLSPWYMDPLYKKDKPYNGKADDFVRELEEEIIPFLNDKLKDRAEYYIIGGYSLAGLFALYSGYRCHCFRRIMSVSGSMWYPGFKEFAMMEKLGSEIEKIYFSLGDKESHTRNEMMASVEEKTACLEVFYSEEGINTIFEKNPGNHFQNVSERIARAINWVIE